MIHYLKISSCLDCPFTGRRLVICPHAAMGGGDIPEACPLPVLPEWRLLEGGEVIQDGDYEIDGDGYWTEVESGHIGNRIYIPDTQPVRRRMRGAQAEKPETRVIHTVAIESLLNSTTEFEFECNQIEHDALAKLIEASKANGTGLPLIWVKQTRLVQP